MPKNVYDIEIGGFSFDPSSGSLRDSQGQEIGLRPQTCRVLTLLAAHPGELVAKDRIMDEVWADTHVTDDSLVQCISEIRKALGPEDGGLLKTVPKQGYRLDLPQMAPPDAPARKLPYRLVVAGLALLLALGTAAWWTLRPEPPGRTGQSIAVLPFDDLGDGDQYRYFAPGIGEDLVVGLSKITDLRVVSRAAAAAVAERDGDPRGIAGELNVTHLVDGSVRRVGDSLRMTVELIDGATGENLWAESYEGPLDGLFGFQDDVLEQTVRVLAVRLSPAERERLGVHGTKNVSAHDNYLRGLELQNFLTPAANRDAETALAEAIRLDPGYAAAHAHMSLTLSMRAEYDWTSDPDTTVRDALRFAERAVELDPDLPFAHFALGRLKSRSFVGDKDGALEEFRTAIRLDPNYVDAYAFMAIVLVSDGRADEALETIEQAMARNPFPPYWYFVPLGLSNYYLGNYEAAADAFNAALERNPNSPNAIRLLIATYGRLGDTDEADWMAAEYEARGLTATVSAIMEDTGLVHPPYREALIEGLRLSGIPE